MLLHLRLEKYFLAHFYARDILTRELGEQLELSLLVAFVGDEAF